MVMHPSPGHPTGTLVNAILHHCKMPAIRLEIDAAGKFLGLMHSCSCGRESDICEVGKGQNDASEESEEEDESDGLWSRGRVQHGEAPVIRPGIVHRIDKGTTGETFC